MMWGERGRRQFLQAASGTIFGGGLLHGSSQFALAEAKVSERWRFNTNNEFENATIVVDSGTVYVGSANSVHALDASDGSQQWTFEADDDTTLAVDSGTVYVGSANSVHALDASDGSQQWTFEADGSVYWPAVNGGTVYVGSYVGMYALNASDGSQRWKFKTGSDSARASDYITRPAVDSGTVYVGAENGNVYALDASDGSQQWVSDKSDTESWPAIYTPAVDSGTVYVGTNDGNVHALDASDGSQQWIFETSGNTFSPAVDSGTVYASNTDGNLYALDANDGSQQWIFEASSEGEYTTGNTLSSPAVDSGTVYVGSFEGRVYAVDASDGSQQWAYEASGNTSKPEIDSGTVYVSYDGIVYALNSSNLTPTPTETQTPTPTETRTPTPTETQTPTPEETESGGTSEDETGILPIAIGLLGVGSAGAWWLTRGDDDDDRHQTGDTPMDGSSVAVERAPMKQGSTRGESAKSDEGDHSSQSGPSGDSEVVATVNDLRDEGDELREEARKHRETGEHVRALEAYQDAEVAHEEALEKATDSDLDTTPLEQTLADIKDDKRDVRGQHLESDVNTIRDELEQADTLAQQEEFKTAKATLDGLAADIESAKETAIQHGFDDRREELTTLEQQREDRLEDVTERLKASPVPDTIPRAPNISVDYDALTDREPIGKGGGADVMKATHPTPNGDVTLAIKEPRMSGTLHTEAVERMLEEAETWDKLDDHDHIVGVIDHGSAPIPWIAMEYMDAGHLGERSGTLDLPRALWTATAVTKGVRHAHRRGVAHLDLKPENVLFRSIEEKWDVPKVADWGLSRHLLDHSKSIDGLSPQYAAPEQFDEDFGSADDITDIYQLGAVFYELFTGQPPFEGKPAKAMHEVLHEQPTPPSEIADVPAELDAILLTALAKEKADRYDNVVYLRDALQDMYEGL